MNALGISDLSRISEVSPQQMAALRAQGQAKDFIDVRTSAEYDDVHAVGARLEPLDRLDCKALVFSRMAPDEPVYLICKSGTRAAKAAERIAALGCEAAWVDGGTDGWAKAGLPVVRGKRAISLERQVRIAAGLLVLLGVILGATMNRWFYAISGFVGAGLTFAGITDTCAMGMLLAKMPWNQRRGSCKSRE